MSHSFNLVEAVNRELHSDVVTDSEAMEVLQQSVEDNVPAAMNMLGYMFRFGYQVPKDAVEAAGLFEAAATATPTPCKQGQHNFGVSLLEGRGVEKNRSLGFEFVLAAASGDDGLPESMSIVADCLLVGIDAANDGIEQVAPNPQEAFIWRKKSSDKGNVNATFKLGKMYYEGVGVSKDPERGLRSMVQAAEHGHEEAKRIAGKKIVHQTMTETNEIFKIHIQDGAPESEIILQQWAADMARKILLSKGIYGDYDLCYMFLDEKGNHQLKERMLQGQNFLESYTASYQYRRPDCITLETTMFG